jgi:hypothetical protein
MKNVFYILRAEEAGQRSGGPWLEASQGKPFERPYLENMLTKKGRWSDSSDRAPA